MTTETLKRVNKIRFGVALAIVGLLFTVLGGITLLKNKSVTYAETQATITTLDEYYDMLANGLEGETMHKVYVDYTVDGEEYKNVEYGSYDSSMKEGDTVTISYNTADPGDISAPDATNLPYFFLAGGIVVLAAGLVIFITSIKKKEA